MLLALINVLSFFHHFIYILSDKLDGLLDLFIGNSHAKSYYQLDENGLVHTGMLLAKPDTAEFHSMLTGYQTDPSYTGGADAAEYLTHHFLSSDPLAHIVQDFSTSAVVASFGLTLACGKPWQCYYNSSWDSATHDVCLSLNNAWFRYRASFETRWSKRELVNTTMGNSTYYPNFFLGYCYGDGDGAGEYQRAADYSPVTKYTCPSFDGETIDLGSAGGTIELETSTNLCTLTQVMTDGSSDTTTIFPIARSYESHEWEAAAGPQATAIFAATSSSPITCESSSGVCTVTLPPLLTTNDNAKYVLTTFVHAVSARNEAARFLEKTTFGPTTESITALLDGSNNTALSDAQKAGFCQNQMSDLTLTSHREYWRKRTNAKVRGGLLFYRLSIFFRLTQN